MILMSKTNIIQLSEFDVTQKIIESLTNVCTRTVLFAIKDEAKDATKISEELNISQSTVYKTLSQLEELALIEVDKFIFSSGKKIKLYKSRIAQVNILIKDTEPVLELYPNENISKNNSTFVE
jgi:predicted transcriptional regulator